MNQLIVSSNKTSVQSAISDIASQLHQDIKLLILMCPTHSLKEATSLLKDILKDVPLIGVSTICSLAKDQIISEGITAIGLTGDLVVETGLIENIHQLPVKGVKDLKKSISNIHPIKDQTILLEFCTTQEEKLVSTLRLAIDDSPIELIGGTAFASNSDNLVAYEGHIYKDACVYAIIKNLEGKIKIYKENIYSANNHPPLLVTKAHEREIIEIEGKPAATAYADALGIDVNNIKQHVLSHPFAKLVGKEEYLVAIKDVLHNGSLVTYKKMASSDQLKLQSLTNYQEQIPSHIQKIKSETPHIGGVLSINCIYRYLLFNQDNYLPKYAKEMSILGSHAGFISAGEQFKIQHINQTMVCIVFETRED